MAAAEVIPVFLIEDDVRFRNAVRDMLDFSGRFICRQKFGSAREALQVKGPPPRLILLDLELPGVSGVDSLPALRAKWPEADIVVLTGTTQADTIFPCLRRGAVGYLLKGEGTEGLIAALEDVLAGGSPITPSIARRLTMHFASTAPITPGENRLSPRENEVLAELAAGKLYKEIGDALGLTLNTVRQHVRSIYRKLEVGSRTEATVRFLKQS